MAILSSNREEVSLLNQMNRMCVYHSDCKCYVILELLVKYFLYALACKRNYLVLFSFQILGKFVYSELGGCGRGIAHQTCLTVMAREPGSTSLCVYALEAPSSELAHEICKHIG